MKVSLALVCALAAGCSGDLDPPWQLDHDRIVAVRSTPPAIAAGERAELDLLVATAGVGTAERSPELVVVVTPASLASALAFDGGKWRVTAPGEPELAAARTELGLEPAAPVPLRLVVSFGGGALLATKVVWLGMTAQNPSLSTMMVDGSPADAKPELVVAPLVDVPLSIDAIDTDDVNWLTSCGTMHDYDLPQAYLRVELEDPMEGELAVVLCNARGGVAWRVWPIHAE